MLTIKLFKISIKQLFLSLVLSVFIGTFLYLYNGKKVSIEYLINIDQIVNLNSCTSVSVDKETRNSNILGADELKQHLNYHQIYNGVNAKVHLKINESYIKLKVNGFLEASKYYDQFVFEYIQLLREAGSKKFEILYSSAKVHCSGVDFPALKFYPSSEVIYRWQNFRYSQSHLWFLAVLPLIAMYLILVAFNYKKYCLDKQD